MTKERGPIEFSPKELIEARGLSKWAGETKYLTTDCPDCRFYLIHEDRLETCEWGVAWKELVPREKGKRTCGLLKQSSPKEEWIAASRTFLYPKKV